MTPQTPAMPLHDGEMLKRQAALSPLKLTALARRMEVAHSTLLWYFGSPNLRSSVLWRASTVLERNFFYDLGMQLPPSLPSALDTAHTRRIAELEREVERLRIENETYQKILAR